MLTKSPSVPRPLEIVDEHVAMHALHERCGTMNILGNYADLAKSLGGWSERVEEPNQIVSALQRARKAADDGKAALLEFITSREINYSRMRD